MAPILTTGTGVFPVIAGGAAVTWNNSDKSANNTLSNGFLTVTRGAAGAADALVRSTSNSSTGQRYFEVHIDNIAVATSSLIGIATAGLSLSTGPGITADGLGIFDGSGNIFINSTIVGGYATAFVTGNTVGFACDFNVSKIWIAVSSAPTVWNNGGGADPTTNTGGVSISTLNAGPYFPAISLHDSGDAYTVNFGASGYVIGKPSGYSNWS